MEKVKVLIFAGGDIEDYSFVNQYVNISDYIICADSGIGHTRKINLLPDLIVGDFDSASQEDINYYREKDIDIKNFPTRKDKTDTEIALDMAIEKGAKKIYIIGGTGTRLDHSLGNIHLLYYALQKNVSAVLINQNNIVHLIDKEIIISGEKGSIISLIPFSLEVKGVFTKGLDYSLKDAVLYSGSSYGISNVMTSSTATIAIKSGFLLIIQELKD
jgi:thiamine pyrophosphokinase